MYKRFIRWASDRLADNGIIAFITNRAYIDTRQDDGFRQVAAVEFSDIYLLDLGSDVRRNPKISGTMHNVFGIQTGVAIGFFVRDKDRLGERNIHYARREDAELARYKLSYLRGAKLDEISFEDITPDKSGHWLNQSSSNFDRLVPLADKDTKLAKRVADERAVFKLYSLGVASNRDEWTFDFDKSAVSNKVNFLCKTYQDEMQRFETERPDAASIGDWVNRSIKWTAELETHLIKGHALEFAEANIVPTLYRPFVAKQGYYAPLITHRRYQQPRMFPHGTTDNNVAICFLGPGARRSFAVLATNKVPSLALFIDGTQCLTLYRYTENGRRVSNITKWGIRRINDHYRKEWGKDFGAIYPDGITAEDIFAYTYAVLHNPAYREEYAVDLLREFPRLPLYPNFSQWAEMGQELLDLHVGFESAEPYPLQRIDQSADAKRVFLRPDKERGSIALDDKTTLAGVPPDAWRYHLGSRSALEWVLDQYKERKPKDPTIAEKFNTYRFADHKERVIDLLQRVCAVSLRTMNIVDQMARLNNES